MKRLLVFVALLALGFLALRLAIGDDRPANAEGGTGSGTATPELPPRRTTGREPIELQRDGLGIGVEVYGPLELEQTNLVDTPAGKVRQTVYQLRSGDCRPQSAGGHLLQDVALRLFERGEPFAVLTARSALVELTLDESGRRTIRQDKEIELLGAIFRTLPEARNGPMRFEAERVRVLVEDQQIALHTPDENQEVLVAVGGERSGTLRGRGLRALMPRGNDGPLTRLDVRLLSRPVVESEGVAIRADGALHYVEDLRTGLAMLTVERSVRIELASGGVDGARTGRGGPVTLRGDQLLAWLQRSRDAAPAAGARPARGTGVARDGFAWTLLRLLGSRAQVRSSGVQIDSPRLSVLPGPGGGPWIVTADYGVSDLVQRRADGSVQATFHSSRPIRMVRPTQWLDAVHGAFGFPGGTFGSLRDVEILVFEGNARLDAEGEVHVSADRGMRVYRLDARREDGPLVARGFGNVQIEQGRSNERTNAYGDNGFVMERSTAGDVLRLGDDAPRTVQHFELERGDVRLRGRGTCRVERDADGTVAIALRSDDASIAGSFGAALGDLQAATALDATLRDRTLVSFATAGHPVAMTWLRDGRRLEAFAADVRQIGPQAMRLLGAAGERARIVHPPTADVPRTELQAPRIDVFQTGPDAVLVDAQADAGSRASLTTALPVAAGRAPTSVDVDADRIRLLPYAIPPAALRPHLFGSGPAVAAVVARTPARPWILAEHGVDATIVDPEEGRTHAVGSALIVSEGTRSGLLVGDAATGELAMLHNRQLDGREITAHGARVRFFRGQGERIEVLPTFAGQSALWAPRVVLHDPRAGSANDPLAHLLGECNGSIAVDPDAIVFRGPVLAQGLRDDGTVDPKGMRLVGQHVTMTRQRDTRRVVRISALGGAQADWRAMHARAQHLEIDLLRQRCLLEGEDGAFLRFGGGPEAPEYRARRIEANYVTYAANCWFGHFGQSGTDGQ